MLKINNLLRVCLDTNIFIYYFQGHPKFGPVCRNLILKLQKSKKELITSTITLTEVLAYPMAKSTTENLQSKLLTNQYLKLINVGSDIAIKAAEIRRLYGYKLADSLQLGTAQVSNCDVFITNDTRLKKFKEVKVILLSEIKF